MGSLNNTQRILEMARLLALLNDGHTRTQPDRSGFWISSPAVDLVLFRRKPVPRRLSERVRRTPWCESHHDRRTAHRGSLSKTETLHES